jgi:hypothetical protein
MQGGALTLYIVCNTQCEVTSPPLCVRNIHVRLCLRPISVPHFTCLTLVCLLTLSRPKLGQLSNCSCDISHFIIKN